MNSTHSLLQLWTTWACERKRERERERGRVFMYVCVRVCKKQRAVDSRREKTYGTRAHLQSPVLRES